MPGQVVLHERDALAFHRVREDGDRDAAARGTAQRAEDGVVVVAVGGVPVTVDGERLAPVALIERLEALGASYAIGRGIHLGDTILGTKGRD